MNAYIGIDPGKKGAMCALLDDGTMQIKDFDENIQTMMDWLIDIKSSHNVEMCMIEDVHSIFGTSAKSNFNFGFNTGIMHGMIRGLGLPLDLVQPKAWQKFVGIKSKGKEIKKDVANTCERLYPSCDIRGARGGLLDGRSDALMISHYCKLKYK